MKKLQKFISEIKPLVIDKNSVMQNHLDSLTKPQGSLGRLEELAKWFISIRNDNFKKGDDVPLITEKYIFTMAADHGVATKGVSAFPQEVTPQMVLNFLNGGAGINVLARHVGANVIVVDCGIASDLEPQEGLLIKKVGYGTKDISEGPAMTAAEAEKAIFAGIESIEEQLEKGLDIIGTGDMGIANTTPSTAILAAYSSLPVEDITGRGTGVDGKSLLRKQKIVRLALERNQPDTKNALDVLAKVGGFEIGAIAGLCLAGARYRIPVVVDGFISTAGALLAVKIKPEVSDYLLCAHKSAEPGHVAMMKELNGKPMLDLGFRLGEGTGAALAIGLVEAGHKIYREMATFADASVSEKANN